ncbi:MAG: beta-lactamase family protein [Ruminococcus sp.]|nr:beta-lactamase family protein [Ruminococcus sp.]
MNVMLGKTDCKPAETGYDESRIDKLNERLQSMIDRELVHGAAYCISHKGKIIAHGALGRNNSVGEDTPMRPDTVFGIASITKVFTATAMMQLAEDGIFNLNDPVGNWLPQFARRPFSDVKLIHLLTHTSGLYPDAGCFDELFPKSSWELIKTEFKAWDKQRAFDWISAGISAGLRRPVGTEWQYSSFLFCVLGEIIGRASGIPAVDYITQKILKPLNLKDSCFDKDITQDIADRFYHYDKNTADYLKLLVSGNRPMTEEDEMWEKIPPTGGGINSTVYDLVRFGNAFVYNGRLDGARILGRKSVEKMSTVQLCNIPDRCWGAQEPNRLYGIGFDIRRTPAFTYSDRTIMHEGSGASSIDIDLDEQLVAAWYVPFNKVPGGWCPEPLYNVQNIIWSGLI